MKPLKISASDITPELDSPVTSFTIGFMLEDRVCSRIMFCLLSMSLSAERFKIPPFGEDIPLHSSPESAIWSSVGRLE